MKKDQEDSRLSADDILPQGYTTNITDQSGTVMETLKENRLQHVWTKHSGDRSPAKKSRNNLSLIRKFAYNTAPGNVQDRSGKYNDRNDGLLLCCHFTRNSTYFKHIKSVFDYI